MYDMYPADWSRENRRDKDHKQQQGVRRPRRQTPSGPEIPRRLEG